MTAAFNTTEPTGTPVDIGHGVTKYLEYCVQCHGDQFGRGGGAIPELPRSSDAVIANYDKIRLEGLLEARGMPNFADRLTEQDDVNDIKQFVLYTATSLKSGMQPMEF
jgi:quinohemoprotein ethanol dehydrogenase